MDGWDNTCEGLEAAARVRLREEEGEMARAGERVMRYGVAGGAGCPGALAGDGKRVEQIVG